MAGPRSALSPRAIHHSTMKALARQFAAPGDPAKLAPALNAQPTQPALADVARTFQELQQARHETDYDLSRRFTRMEVLLLIDLTQQALDNWQTVRGSLQADTFRAGFPTYNFLKG